MSRKGCRVSVFWSTLGGLPKLPPIQVPFGLDLHDTSMKDDGLKELKELKNLTTLLLGNTRVGDAGLKELKHLPNTRHA